MHIRHGLALLALAASAAPSMTRNHAGHSPFGRRPVRNADGAAASSSGTGATSTTGSTAAAGDAAAAAADTKVTEKMLPQSEVNAILAREKRKLEDRLTAAANVEKELEALREERRQAEEAKLSAAQRAELERKREREAYEKKIADLDTSAKRERDQRHALMRSQRAASTVATFASKLLNDKLAPIAEQTIASRLVVEVQADGTEKLMVRMSDAAADLEPVETALPKLIDAEIAPVFFRAQGGAGSQHGGNGGGGASSWRNLSPADKIAAGLGAKR